MSTVNNLVDTTSIFLSYILGRILIDFMNTSFDAKGKDK